MKKITLTIISLIFLTLSAHAERLMGELIQEAMDSYTYRVNSLEDKLKYKIGQLNDEMVKVNELKMEIADLKAQEKQAKWELKARIAKIKADGAPIAKY